MNEEWIDQLKNVLCEMEEAEDCELELTIEHLTLAIEELESIS